MSDTNNNRGIVLGMAAAAVIAGAALVYKFVLSAEDSTTALKDQIYTTSVPASSPANPVTVTDTSIAADSLMKDELKQAGLAEVKKGSSGTLEPQYVVELLNLVTKNARKRSE